MQEFSFPLGFLFGAATSSYQIEGNNTSSDWWLWEQNYTGKPGGPTEKSGIACDSYNRYEEDFELARLLGHNVHRLSLSWARIEPANGEFNKEEIEHYRKVLKSIKSKGMKTFVTLWHFDVPIWFREIHGWANVMAPKYFERYAKVVAERLGEDIDFYVTMNEPQVYLVMRHILRYWNPIKSHGMLDFLQGLFGLKRAHRSAYLAIKKVDPSAQVGIVENVMSMEPKYKTLWNKFVVELRKTIQFRLIFQYTKADFFGINFYFHDVIGPRDLWIDSSSIETDGNVSDWGWQIFPEGIYRVVKEVAKYKKPLYITENGLADAKDFKREEFIVGHLYWLQKAIAEGADVQGYMHWSLLDNFEWAEGYKWKFGLIEVDRENNLERKIRPSAYTYAKIIRDNGLSKELLRKYKLID